MSEQKLIVGLGNPGKNYDFTRHNLGFLVVSRLAEKLEINFDHRSFSNGLVAKGNFEDSKVWLLLPSTFMNNSGVAVKQMVTKNQFDIENILIVCDELNLDFGQLRLKSEGSHAGNNGIKSIIEKLETDKFCRLRCGIGMPVSKEHHAQYVLSEFSRSEKQQLQDYCDEAAQCCLVWLKSGKTKAMDQFNKRKNNGKK